jgi:hypothetical protein
MKPLRVLGALGAMVLLCAPAAFASRPARQAEQTAVTRVTKTYIDTSDCCTVITGIKVYSVRISTVNPRWARVKLDGYNQNHELVGVVFAVLHRGNLTGRWSVRGFGSDGGLGCDMPLPVRRDLGESCS